MWTWLERAQRATSAVERALGWLPQSLARLVVGWVFLWSGWGKLHNLDGVIQFFASLGIPAPELQAPFVAGTEFVCGALVLAGLATRLAALPLIGVMSVALLTVLAERVSGLTDLFGLSEFCYVALLTLLVVRGAGPISVDFAVARGLAAGT